MQIEAREAVRAVVVAERQALLLLEMAFPWNDGPVWIAPGGGIAPGETAHDALVRELAEEIGLRDPQVGPLLFERTVDFLADRHVRQHELYYLVECGRFEADPAGMEREEQGFFRGFSWWPLAAIATEPRVDIGPELLAAVSKALASQPRS